MKKFDKKSAHRFTLLHRSQQDPLYHAEGGSQAILHPADEKTAQSLGRLPFAKVAGTANYLVKELREVDELGLPLDGYDYGKHLSAMGSGTFMNAAGAIEKVPEALITPKTVELPAESLASETEMPRMLEAITLRPDLMDDDMRHIFEGDEDAGVEELDDDFMAQVIQGFANAAGRSEDAQGEQQGEDLFDFDAHVLRLMRQAEMADGRERDEEEEEEEVAEEVRADSSRVRPTRDVDAHFEAVMEQYDDSDAEVDEQAESAGGALEAANAIVVEAMNDFLRQRAEDMSVGIVADPFPATRAERSTKAGAEEHDAAAAQHELPEEPEAAAEEGDVLEAWGTYKYKAKPQFDCETIVSTFSTLDNNPVVIEVPGRARRGDRRGSVEQLQQLQQQRAASVASSEDDLVRDVARLTLKAIAERVQGETAEEKRARKQAVKEGKRERRTEKKQVKQLYKDEKARLVHAMTAPGAPRSGVSEFKI
jgi:protein LTV1